MLQISGCHFHALMYNLSMFYYVSFQKNYCQNLLFNGGQAQNNSLVNLPEELQRCSKLATLNIEVDSGNPIS